MGWFGPRGLASIVFAVIGLNERLPGENTILLVAIYTTVLSVLGDSSSTHPLVSRLFAAKTRSAGRSSARDNGAAKARRAGRPVGPSDSPQHYGR